MSSDCIILAQGSGTLDRALGSQKFTSQEKDEKYSIRHLIHHLKDIGN